MERENIIYKKMTLQSDVEVINNETDLELIKFIITTETPDRVNEVMKVAGCVYENYLKDPVVLWNHDHQSEPAVATCKDLVIENDKIIASVYFHKLTQLSKELYDLVKNKILRAVSIGFVPLNWEDVEVSGVRIRNYTSWELVEFSIVNVPMNPEALLLNKLKNDKIINKLANDLILKNETGINTETELCINNENNIIDKQEGKIKMLPDVLTALLEKLTQFLIENIDLPEPEKTNIINEIVSEAESKLSGGGFLDDTGEGTAPVVPTTDSVVKVGKPISSGNLEKLNLIDSSAKTIISTCKELISLASGTPNTTTANAKEIDFAEFKKIRGIK